MRSLLGVSLVLSATLAMAQTGRPLWSSLENSAFDAVNRQNLNVNFSIPLVSTPSRAGTFNYALVYDSLIWAKNGTAWSPVSDANGNPIWGWKDNQPLGATTFSHANVSCDTQPPTSSPHWFNYKYTDGGGTVHKFPLNFYSVATACQFPTGPTKVYAVDGSGYFIDASSPSGPIVYSPSGDKITGTRTDSNGNFVSGIVVNGSETDFKDTNGRVTVKKVKSSNTQTQYEILDQTGSYANVIATATYTSKNVKTHFACAGVSEYTATSIYLITQLTLPDGTSYTFTYEATPGFSGYVTARIQRVTLPTGGYYEYDYPTTGNDGINCVDGSGQSLTRTINDGNSNVWTFNTATLSGTTTEQYPPLSYDGGVANTSVFTYSGTQLTQEKIYKGSTTLLRTINRTYAANGSPSVTTAILEDGQKQTKVETDYDSNANLLEMREYDWGTGAPGGLVRRTTKTYLTGSAYTAANILNRVTQLLVKDGSGNIKARTDIGYDDYSGHPMTCVTGAAQHNDASYGCSFATRGNPTSITRYSNAAAPSGALTTNMFYDSLGNSVKADLNGVVQQQSTFSSTTQWAFPDSLTQGPSSGPQLTSSATYNASTGQIASSTDANNQITQYTYDNVRRLTLIAHPDGGQDSYTYNFSSNPPNIVATSKITASSNSSIETILDKLGRPSASELNSDPAGTVYQATAYDAVGRLASITNPYRSTSDPTYGITQYQYDALGRNTNVTNPDSSTNTVSYSDAAWKIQNESGVAKIYQVDGLGRVNSVCEVTNVTQADGSTPSACGQDIVATGFSTLYSYDVLNDLTGVTQGIQTRSYSYDSLSRMTTETNPEINGPINYSYDTNSAGDLYQRTRPAPNQTGPATVTTTYAYDALHRLTQRSYSDGTTLPNIYIYDTDPYLTVNNGKGRLVHQSDTVNVGQHFSYDAMGRIATLYDCIQPNCGSTGFYTLGYTYDLMGDVTSASNGVGVTVGFNYNSAAQLTSMTSSLVDSNHPGTLLSSVQYNALGEPGADTLGNSVSESWSYDKQGRAIGYGSGTGRYSFGNGMTWSGGELLSAGDNVNGNWTFTYDDFGRLSTASCSVSGCTPASFNYKYDRFGNRWQQNLTSGSGPSPQYSFNSSNRPVGFSYDSAGNILSDGLHDYAYDAENRLISVDNGVTATYVYDAAGRRVQRSGTVNWIYDIWGNRVAEVNASTGGWNTGEVYAGSRQVATYVSSTTYFPLADWLGTRRMETDVSGNSVMTCVNLPFGDGRNCTGSVYNDPVYFTGQIWDSESALDNFLFRQYTSTQGRWNSPDPAGLDAVDRTNPQSWNRYAYVMNNPLASIDPLGLKDDCGGPCTPFSLPLGNCMLNVSYHQDQNGYDIPDFNFACSTGRVGQNYFELLPTDPLGTRIAKKKGLFACASEAGAQVSLANGLQALGVGQKGVGGFITNALGGNAFSGITDLVQSFGSGEAGGHNVFYNMAQGVAAGPSQGFAPAFGNSLEGTPWASGPVDVATTAILASSQKIVTGAGQTIQTLNGTTQLGSVLGEAAEWATGFGEAKFVYDGTTYFVGMVQCAAGFIHR